MLVAVRELRKDKLRPAAPRREVSVVKDLQHPDAIQLLEVSENSGAVCLVVEYARGKDLDQYIQNAETRKLGEGRARSIFRG
ncbi:MAG: protein kinase, partial [Streptococcus gallolyticus]|nr:protein kinase [Streptococcus gallolyticus]